MDFAELFSNPSMMHAAVVHMPIAAAVFGLIFIVLSAVFHRNNSIRAITALMFLIASVSSFVAIETGEDARGEVPNTISRAVSDIITDHADFAEKVMYSAVFTLICLLISLVRIDAVRIVALIVAAVGAIVTNVFAAQTGHLGGTLVYNEGIGTPMMKQAAAPPAVEVPLEPVTAPVDAPDGPPDATPPVAPEMTETPPVEAPVVPEPPAEDPELVPIRDFTLEEAQQVSYARDIWPVFDDLCVYCHEDPDADGEFVMTTIADMMKGGKKGGPGIVPGKPDESSIVMYIRGIANPRMPEDEEALPEETLHLIRMWIAAGAIDDTNAPPAENVAPAEEAPTAAAPAEVMKDEASADASTEAPAETAAPADTATEAPAETVAPAEEMTDDASSADTAEAGSDSEAAVTTEAAETTTEAPAADSTDSEDTAPAEEATESTETTSSAADESTTVESTASDAGAESTAEESETPETAETDSESTESDAADAPAETVEAAPEAATDGQSV